MYWILALHFAIDDYPFVFFNLIVPEQKVRFFLGQAVVMHFSEFIHMFVVYI